MFQQEYMLAWIDSDVSAFSIDLIAAAFDPEIKPLWQ